MYRSAYSCLRGTFMGCVVVVVLLARLCLGQVEVPASVPSEERIRTLMERCSGAMGSDHALRDLYAEGSVKAFNHPGETAPLTVKSRGADQYHQEEAYASGMKSSSIHAGRGTFSIGGVKQPMRQHIVGSFQPEHNPALACRTDYESRGLKAEYVGQETLAGQSVFHLKFTAAPKGRDAKWDLLQAIISELHVFIDADNYVVAATRRWVFSAEAIENRSPWETVYSDYRRVDGVMMPFHLENRINGETLREVNFAHFGTGLPLTDSDFK